VSEQAKILVLSASKASGKAMAKVLESSLTRQVEVATAAKPPRDLDAYRLVVCELEHSQRTLPFLSALRKDAHVLLSLPFLDVPSVAYYMQDRRVSHFMARDGGLDNLRIVVERLDSGAIFGLDRFLPPEADICYRRFDGFKKRCQVLEELDGALKRKSIRSRLRRSAIQIAEELIMNAMYQAPVEAGKRLFADVEPRLRIHRRTPRPVSLRYHVGDGAFFISVRDRFGSFRREDLSRYLLRCATQDNQLEEKKLGAGLGLYLIASSATALVVNVLPNQVSEFICVVQATKQGESPIKLLSVTTATVAQ
jgi:hypothetical protein